MRIEEGRWGWLRYRRYAVAGVDVLEGVGGAGGHEGEVDGW